MKFKSILYFLAFLLWGTVAQAQTTQKETPEERKNRIEKINNAKIAFITDKVDLKGDQAQRFWPIYHEHEARRNDLRIKTHTLRNENLDELSQEQIQNALESKFAYRQRELNIEKEYMDRYLKVISPRQLAKFYRAEREFTKLLLERLQTAKR